MHLLIYPEIYKMERKTFHNFTHFQIAYHNGTILVMPSCMFFVNSIVWLSEHAPPGNGVHFLFSAFLSQVYDSK